MQRMIIQRVLLGTIVGSAILVGAVTAWTTRPSSATDQDELLVAPSEPQPADTNLSDPVESIDAFQPLETIDLLKPEENPNLENRPAWDSGAEAVPAGGFVPAESAAEEKSLPRMPPCEAAKLLRSLPGPSQEAGSSEEQEERLQPPVDSRAIEERLKQVLRSYLNNGRWGHAGVDTLEFRPSDAKKGEFDRIPF